MGECRYCGKKASWSEAFRGYVCDDCHVAAAKVFSDAWTVSTESRINIF